IVIDGISADHTEDKHNGVQPLHRYQADFGEDADSTIAQQAHEDVGHKQRDNDGVDIHRLGAEKQRSRCNALHHQGTQHDGCDGVTRDAQGQQWDHGAAGDSIVGGLGSGDAFGSTMAELLRMLGPAFGLVIADPGGDIAAGSGNGADNGADNGAHQDRRTC
ncbi:23S rRNA (pseudouridine(1915)-N(3))-methyltransferase RlmH, partial [Dysosmobacter welbionis]